MNDIPLMQLMMMLIPVLLVYVSLIAFSLLQLSKYGVKNMNKTIWILIILFVQILGPILYLTIGRNTDDYSK